jgi:hypothetical protein
MCAIVVSGREPAKVRNSLIHPAGSGVSVLEEQIVCVREVRDTGFRKRRP